MKICPLCEIETSEDKCPRDYYPTISIEFYKKEVEKDKFIGQTFQDKYKIIERLGSGGMGVVYKGINTVIRQDVAIKILKFETETIKEEILKAMVRRFHREALSASQLNHPNIIKIYDFGQTKEGMFFIVMEYLDGQPLGRVIEKNAPFEIERVINIMKQICSALDEAHSKNIVHRDLKPENIFVIQKTGLADFIKVLDFGIAKIVGGTDESSITRTGTTIGSPPYMSPEQAEGGDIDHRSDLYSLGVIGYYMLSGNLPFDGPHPLSIMMKHKLDPPPPFSELLKNRTPSKLEDLIFKLLEKNRENRPQSAKEVMFILNEIKKPEEIILKEAITEIKTHRVSPFRKFLFKNIIHISVGIIVLTILITLPFLLLKKEKPEKKVREILTQKPVLISRTEVVQNIEKDIFIQAETHTKHGSPSQLESKISIPVKSLPQGVEVWDGKNMIGKTPFSIEIKEGEEKIVVFKKKGYRDEKIKVDMNSKEVIIKLQKLKIKKVAEKETTKKEEKKKEEVEEESKKSKMEPWIIEREKRMKEMEKMMEEEKDKIKMWKK